MIFKTVIPGLGGGTPGTAIDLPPHLIAVERMARIVFEKQFRVQGLSQRCHSAVTALVRACRDSVILAESRKSMATSRSHAPGRSYGSTAAALPGGRPAPAGRAPLFPARKRLFMASLLLAFLFSPANWEGAAGCALLLLLFNTLILPWLDLDATQPPGPLLN